jgi:hypothetical protein
MSGSVAYSNLGITRGPSRCRGTKCPICSQHIFCGDADATFNCHGFETYQVDCGVCRASLDGVVVPFDDILVAVDQNCVIYRSIAVVEPAREGGRMSVHRAGQTFPA